MLQCDRCQATPDKFDQESVNDLRIMEVHTNFGFSALMCYKCRCAWSSWMFMLPEMREHVKINFQLNHWQSAHQRTGKEDIKIGLGFSEKLLFLEEKVFRLAREWVSEGLTTEEEKERNRVHSNNDDNDERWR